MNSISVSWATATHAYRPRRWAWFVWVVLALVPSLGGAVDVSTIRPVPDEIRDGNSYFPLTSMREWTYQFMGTDQTLRMVLRKEGELDLGSGPQAWPGALVESYEQTGAQDAVHSDGSVYRIESDGIYLVWKSFDVPGKPREKYDPPQLIIPTDLAKAETWLGSGAPHRVLGLSNVETRAGSFEDCVVIGAWASTEEGALPVVYNFYAEDVGLVAVIMKQGTELAPILELTSWEVLEPPAIDAASTLH